MLYIWSAFICLAPYECTCGSSFLHVNVFIHLCSECKLLFIASYHHDLKCGFSFSTCYCEHVHSLMLMQPVSYFSLLHILCVINGCPVLSLAYVLTYVIHIWHCSKRCMSCDMNFFRFLYLLMNLHVYHVNLM